MIPRSASTPCGASTPYGASAPRGTSAPRGGEQRVQRRGAPGAAQRSASLRSARQRLQQRARRAHQLSRRLHLLLLLLRRRLPSRVPAGWRLPSRVAAARLLGCRHGEDGSDRLDRAQRGRHRARLAQRRRARAIRLQTARCRPAGDGVLVQLEAPLVLERGRVRRHHRRHRREQAGGAHRLPASRVKPDEVDRVVTLEPAAEQLAHLEARGELHGWWHGRLRATCGAVQAADGARRVAAWPGLRPGQGCGLARVVAAWLGLQPGQGYSLARVHRG